MSSSVLMVGPLHFHFKTDEDTFKNNRMFEQKPETMDGLGRRDVKHNLLPVGVFHPSAIHLIRSFLLPGQRQTHNTTQPIRERRGIMK